MDTKVFLFTLKGCHYCDELKTKLDSLSIKYKELEVSNNRTRWESVVNETNQDLLPAVFIMEDDDGNGVNYIPERDFKDLDHLVYIIKNSI